MKNIPAFAAIFPCVYIGTHHIKGACVEMILTLGLHQWHLGHHTLIIVVCMIGLALATGLVQA